MNKAVVVNWALFSSLVTQMIKIINLVFYDWSMHFDFNMPSEEIVSAKRRFGIGGYHQFMFFIEKAASKYVWCNA